MSPASSAMGETVSDSPWNSTYFGCMDMSDPVPVENAMDAQQAIGMATSRPAVTIRGHHGFGACLQCRARHIKCDFVKPKCGRCSAEDRHCEFVASRRGGQNKKTIGKKRPTTITTTQASLELLESLAQPDLNFNPALLSTASNTTITDRLPLTPASAPPSPATLGARRDEHINLYYEKFHDAHPYILPKKHLLSLITKQNFNEGISQLLLVVLYIGSIHSKESGSETLQRQALAALNSPLSEDSQISCYSVQALLLLSIALYSRDNTEIACSLLRRASEVAISLKMHARDFAAQHAHGDPVVRESWKRTYWGIFVTETIFAAMTKDPAFGLVRHLGSASSLVELPGEDFDYNESIILEPSKTMQEYDDRVFSSKEGSFSSFAHLISICRIAGGVAQVMFDFLEYPPGNPCVGSADVELSNWEMQLPEDKQAVVNRNGGIDELMFQAQTLFHALRLVLHRPRSHLLYQDIENLSQCTQIPSSEQVLAKMQNDYNVHTQRACKASTDLLLLFGLPGDVHRHSPLLMCALAIAMTAQLSALMHGFVKCTKASKEMIMLGLNAMLKLGAVSALGVRSRREMQQIAVYMLNQAENGAHGEGSGGDTDSSGETNTADDYACVNSKASPATPPPETSSQNFHDPVLAQYMDQAPGMGIHTSAVPANISYTSPKNLNGSGSWDSSSTYPTQQPVIHEPGSTSAVDAQDFQNYAAGGMSYPCNQQPGYIPSDASSAHDGSFSNTFGSNYYYNFNNHTDGNGIVNYGDFGSYDPAFRSY